VAAAVVRRDGCVLLTQRPPGGALGLQWEFPGGKIEPGETAEIALAREIHEELGVRATPGRVLGVSRYAYPHGLEVEIVFLECELESFDLKPGAEVHAMRWSRPRDVDRQEVLAGDRDFLDSLEAG
jgi:8-oxo-dGTP diphosphatase